MPNLRLKYPDDNELRCIAQLAGVRDTLAFGQSIPSIILDAHLSDQAFRTLSIPEVSKAINDVTEQAELLKKILIKLDVGSGSEGSLMEAGRLIEVELYALQNFTIGDDDAAARIYRPTGRAQDLRSTSGKQTDVFPEGCGWQSSF